MELTQQEIKLIDYVLQADKELSQDGTPQPRTYTIKEQTIAIGIFEKVEDVLEEDKDGNKSRIPELAVIEFTTSEKTFLLESLNRKLAIAEARIASPLRTKLN
tara:strand:- start:10606 stop:10914 length:309 start_codon:yes stop_codon:yes gene_type:complete